MQSLFQKYDLEVVEKNETIVVLSTKNYSKILSGFFFIWQNLGDIKEEIIPEIDKILTGEISVSHDIDADVVGSADVYPDITHLGWSEVGYKDMTLPTEDFKQLWLEWVDILESYQKRKKALKQ